jgi:hypothetical protein
MTKPKAPKAQEPTSDLAALKAKVDMMRELGVTECDGIKLGALPPPEPKPPTAEDLRERKEREEERRRDVQFAASSIKPALRVVKR